MHTVFHFDLSYWNLLITVILPAVVALVTKRFAPGNLKAIVLLVLSVIGGLVNQIIAQGGSFEVGKTLWYVAGTFLVAALTHYGLLQPLGLTGALGTIAKNMPGGLGPAGTDVAPPATPVVVTPAAPAAGSDQVIVEDDTTPR